ncbi:MAG: hypothetical protein HOP23_17290 [Methylococcaceae bacterium]|nr:hypothetical protein [Methylococcaceae bacterium]
MSKLQPDTQHPVVNIDKAYGMALEKIAHLDHELQQKNKALDINMQEQVLLRKRLQDCILTIQETTSQLVLVESELKSHYKLVLQHVDDLAQEIKKLESANDAWSKRTISLEFDILSVQAALNAAQTAHAQAIRRVTLLENELQSVNAENGRLRQNKGNP